MKKRSTTTEKIMMKWIRKASQVPQWKRQRFMEMIRAGLTVGEARGALELPLMVAAQIIIEEFPAEGPQTPVDDKLAQS